MTKDEALKLALETLESNKQTHYYCEDTWYSCPQHEDGCANESTGDECNCGANEANAEIGKAITAIKEALAQEQDNAYIYASSLATAIWQKHYIKEAPKFELLDTTEGVLTQIDNMTCGLVREKPAQPEQELVAHSVIAGVLFDFMGWLTSRKERIVLSSVDEASPAVEAITEFAKMRNLSLDDAKVQDWHTTPPQRKWRGLTDYEIYSVLENLQVMHHRKPTTDSRVIFAQAIEDKLMDKNT